MEFIINYFSLVIIFFATMFGFGLFNAIIERQANTYIYACFGKLGLWLTSFIGTTVHELGHAFFVILNGQKINKIKLFPKISDFDNNPQLGYVNYSHSNTFWGMLSMFFIGIGPILFGPITILVLMKLLIPSTYFVVFDKINEFLSSGNIEVLRMLFEVIGSFIKGFLNVETLTSVRFYIFLYLAGSIACHTTLSLADIKGALRGFLFLLFGIFAFGFIVTFISGIQTQTINLISIVCCFFVILYIMSLAFSLITFIFNYFLFSIIRN